MQLEGKRIIVTGGASGIAAGTVKGYVKEGAEVVFCDVNDEGGKATEAAANAQEGVTGKATYFHCNIASKAEVDEFFEKAKEILGGLDVLAHIAAVERTSPAEYAKEEDMDLINAVNIKGTMFTNQAAYRIFKEQNYGNIINYTSDSFFTGMRDGSVYAASKGAVIGWTRTLALEWASASNVRCNCVSPAIKTPMYESHLATIAPEIKEAFLAELKRNFPLYGDMGEIDTDIVPVMVFLASDASRYINGQTIGVNGGLAFSR